jgi:hypothetical protein
LPTDSAAEALSEKCRAAKIVRSSPLIFAVRMDNIAVVRDVCVVFDPSSCLFQARKLPVAYRSCARGIPDRIHPAQRMFSIHLAALPMSFSG